MRETFSRSGRLPSISSAEWEVMRVVWRRGSGTANQVVEDLAAVHSWKPKTVQTLLRRLYQKGALEYEKQGREFVYSPVVDERDCQLAEGQSFLQRAFDGKIAPFLAAFVEQDDLTPEEIEELKQILERSKSDE